MAPVLEGKSIGPDQRNNAKRSWKTKNHAKDQGKVQLNDSICFNPVQIGS
jgi:hypothetical protein